MTTFHIKLLAALLMVIDHVGKVFFPDLLVLRYVGRLSFPLFAWLVGQGEKYTKDFNNYLLRLVICGLISQPIYYLIIQSSRPNILATLSLGLLAIRLGKVTRAKPLVWCLFAGLAQLTNSEYGAYGIFVIALLSEFDSNNSRDAAWWVLWVLIHLLFFPLYVPYQVLALFSPLILMFRNGERGEKARWFYAFYPLHLALILLVSYFQRVP